METLETKISDMVFIRTKKLTDPTGIVYPSFKKYDKGVSWLRAKIRAMEDGAPDDCIIVSYSYL